MFCWGKTLIWTLVSYLSCVAADFDARQRYHDKHWTCFRNILQSEEETCVSKTLKTNTSGIKDRRRLVQTGWKTQSSLWVFAGQMQQPPLPLTDELVSGTLADTSVSPLTVHSCRGDKDCHWVLWNRDL